MKRFVIPDAVDLTDIDVTQTVSLPSRMFSGSIVEQVRESHVVTAAQPAAPPVVVKTTPNSPKQVTPEAAATISPPIVQSSPVVRRVQSLPSSSPPAVVPRRIPSVSVEENVSVQESQKASSSTAAVKRAVSGVVRAPFSKLLGGCCFSVSGIANPERSELRTMLFDMGATYSHDWTPACTHLIATFEAADKFRDAAAAGRTIVRSSYIRDVHAKRALLPLTPVYAFRVAASEPLLRLIPASSTATPPADESESTVELSSKKKQARTADADDDDDDTQEL
jgi:hypothetical protein